jgi:hypothetical protein
MSQKTAKQSVNEFFQRVKAGQPRYETLPSFADQPNPQPRFISNLTIPAASLGEDSFEEQVFQVSDATQVLCLQA